VAYILLNKSMDMNSYKGIQTQLSLFGDALITLGETIAKAKAEQQVARILGRPGFCLGIQRRDSGHRPEERFT
jgi:hypothetical protein